MLNLPKIQKLFVVAIAISLSISCTRKNDNSTVSINLEDIVNQSSKSGKTLGSPSSQTISMADVEVIRINVTGSGMQKIFWAWDSGGRNINPPSVISLPIPKGSSRLFQVMAIFSSEEEEVFQYGDHTTEISQDTVTIPIQLNRLGGSTSTQVRVGGRYEKCSVCNGSDTIRPSGNILMEYIPPGKPAMTIEKFNMLGGWFNLIGMVGTDYAPFKYTLEETGEVIFDNVDFRQSNTDTNNPFKVDAFANKVRVEIPSYYIHQGNGSFRFSPTMEIIVGNFIRDTDSGVFHDAVTGSISTVKYHNFYSNWSAGNFTAANYSKIYDSDAYSGGPPSPQGTPISWSTGDDSSLTTINRVAGGSAASCVTENANNFSSQLCIFGHLYNNDAHDSFGFKAPFKYYVTETGYTDIKAEYINDKALLRFQLLPDVLQSGSNPYGLSGIDVLVARNIDPNSTSHDLKCENLSPNYVNKGTISGADLASTDTTGYVVQGASSSDHIVLCPYTFNGVVKKYYESQSVFSYDYTEYQRLSVFPVDGNNTLVGNTCTEWKVQVQDRYGNNVNVESPSKVKLVLESAGAQVANINTYNSSSCVSTLGSKEIQIGQGSFSFWIKNNGFAPNNDIKVLAISEMAKFGENYAALTVSSPSVPNEISSVFIGYDTLVSECTPMKVRLINNSGAVYSFTNSSTAVSLGILTPATIPGKFYSDSRCETEITQTEIPANHNSKLVYYKSGASVTDTSEVLSFTAAGYNPSTPTIDIWVASGFSGQLLSLLTNTAGYVEPGSCTKIKLGVKHSLSNMFLFKNTNTFSSTISFGNSNLYTNDICSPGTTTTITPINYMGPFSQTYSFAAPASAVNHTINLADPTNSNSLDSSTILKTIRPVKLFIQYSLDGGTNWTIVPDTNTISGVSNNSCMTFQIRIQDSNGMDYTANPAYELYGNYTGTGGPSAGDTNVFRHGTLSPDCYSGGTAITAAPLADFGDFAINSAVFAPILTDLRFVKTVNIAPGSGYLKFYVMEGSNPIIERVIQISD